MVGRMAACFDDCRDPGRTEHGLEALLRRRVFGVGMGYEDLSDHNRIPRGSVLAPACGRDDLSGQKRARAHGREYPLAGSSTLNRLELGTPGSAESHRYKKIVADPERLDALLVDLFLERTAAADAAGTARASRDRDRRTVAARPEPEPCRPALVTILPRAGSSARRRPRRSPARSSRSARSRAAP